MYGIQMLRYKRNQVEEAISRLLEPKSQGPTSGMRTRIRRLLETDRDAAGDRGIDYAFFSAGPPGSGVEVWFSPYEAFALLTGLRLMAHGRPQGKAVSVMRDVRPTLEPEHERTLAQDPHWLFDQEAISKNARPGDHAFDNRDPVLLVIISSAADRLGEAGGRPRSKICRSPYEAHLFFQEVGDVAGAMTMIELATSAHQLAAELEKTEPRSRGRRH
jgi:hypothetical protein